MRTRRSSRQHAMGSGRRRLLAERPERTLSRHFVPTAPEGPRRQPYGYRLRPARAPSAAFPAVRDLMNQAIWSTSVGGVPPCIFFLFSTFPDHRTPELAAERRAGQSQDRGPIPRQDVVQSQDVILARYRDTTTLSESPVVRERYERTARVGRRSRPIMHPPERSMGRLSWVRRAWRRWRRALCRFSREVR